jgi:hypothetical protein
MQIKAIDYMGNSNKTQKRKRGFSTSEEED